ncbi:MAG: glycosyltransferase [Lachnospiraceae bacterium]|nr:glycosyltransferase [Lachnospiraceae bacterium]
MEDIKLSVMITTYNLQDYIDKAIESVISQNCDFKYEILVGDDGSSDGTVDRVKVWQKKYPEIIKIFVMDREPDKIYNRIERASANRINLINNAGGDYLIFLDGDDFYIDDNKLKKQVDILDSDEYEGCIACAHNIWMYWNEDKKEKINKADKLKVVKSRDYWKYGMYLHSDTIMFRNIYKSGIVDELLKDYYDDNIIMFCLMDKGDIVYIPDTMVCYRQLENSSWNSVDDMEKNIINLMDLDVEFAINKSFKRESILRHLYQMYFIWRNPNDVTEELYNKYCTKINKGKLSWTKHWIGYKNCSNIRKLRMSLWMLFMLLRYSFIKINRTLLRKNL